jgi:hypothetical protein
MNRATKINVSTIGIVLAIAGLAHGIPEILQGNAPTEGLIIQAIGLDHQMWQYGTEEAFTLLPTYLSTGLVVVSLSLALIVWSLGFLNTKHGATVLGLLFIGLFLFGGGIAVFPDRPVHHHHWLCPWSERPGGYHQYLLGAYLHRWAGIVPGHFRQRIYR